MLITKKEDLIGLKRNTEIEFVCEECKKTVKMKYEATSRVKERFEKLLCRSCHMRNLKKEHKTTSPKRTDGIAIDFDNIDKLKLNAKEVVKYICPSCKKERKNFFKYILENRKCNYCKTKENLAKKYGSSDAYYKKIRSYKENYGKEKQVNIFVKNDEDIKNIQKPFPKYIEFNCSECGELSRHWYRSTWRFPLFCRSCMSKKHNTSEVMALKLKKAYVKYGSREAFYEAQKEKREETNLKKYGVKSLFELKEFQEEIREKAKAVIKEKYGVDNPSQIEEVRVANKLRWSQDMRKEQAEWFTTEEFKRKSRKTCFERYGVSNGGGSKEAIEKIQKTKIEKYGSGHIEKKYKYKNETFDSSWELAFYIYCLDNSILVEHETEKLEYYCDGKKHYYFPDFKIGDELIEIKGDQFFKNGEFVNPYGETTKQMKEKYKCMLKNDVKILKKAECQKYLDYVNLKYGNDYLSSFKKERNVA